MATAKATMVKEAKGGLELIGVMINEVDWSVCSHPNMMQ